MSHRKSTRKDTGGLEESGAYTNDAFVKEEGPPVGRSEREIEKYRRSTIKKSISANRFSLKKREDDDDDVEEKQNGRANTSGKRQPYHRQHCAKRKFKESHNYANKQSTFFFETKTQDENKERKNSKGAGAG